MLEHPESRSVYAVAKRLKLDRKAARALGERMNRDAAALETCLKNLPPLCSPGLAPPSTPGAEGEKDSF